MNDLFFKGEIPALESDKEGKLKGGFSAMGGGISFFMTDDGCVNTDGDNCRHLNRSCHNECTGGSNSINRGCTNTCAPSSSDSNKGCENSCGTVNAGCTHTDEDCTTVSNKKDGLAFSIFDLGSSALF